MRIAIGAFLGVLGGPRTYAYNLIKNLIKIDKENQYFFISDHFDGLDKIEGLERIKLNRGSAYTQIFWDHMKIPVVLKKYKIDIYHDAKNVLPLLCPCKSLVTIHDLAPFLLPETFQTLQRFSHKFHMQWAVAKAKRIITVSENSREDIIRILKVEERKVLHIPNGVVEIFHKIEDAQGLETFRQELGLAKRIILCVGTIQPRKNLDIVIKAFDWLKRKKRIPHQLVIVGRCGWLWQNIKKMVHKLNLTKDVIFTGPVADEKLPIVYNLAEVFLAPSSYEGFGLTILEAMACGTAVITSNTSSLPEIAGNSALMIEPRNVEQLQQAIEKILSNKELRDRLITKGLERAREFSWERCARETLEVYKEVGQK